MELDPVNVLLMEFFRLLLSAGLVKTSELAQKIWLLFYARYSVRQPGLEPTPSELQSCSAGHRATAVNNTQQWYWMNSQSILQLDHLFNKKSFAFVICTCLQIVSKVLHSAQVFVIVCTKTFT